MLQLPPLTNTKKFHEDFYMQVLVDKTNTWFRPLKLFRYKQMSFTILLQHLVSSNALCVSVILINMIKEKQQTNTSVLFPFPTLIKLKKHCLKCLKSSHEIKHKLHFQNSRKIACFELMNKYTYTS